MFSNADKLAFLGNSDCNASKFLPDLYDGAKCMSNKGKQTYTVEIAQYTWPYIIGCFQFDRAPAIEETYSI